MNLEEVLALRRAFNSVKERQRRNKMDDFEERKERLKDVRKLCVGNDTLVREAIAKLENNGITVYLAKEKQEAIEIIHEEIGTERLVVKSKSNVTKEIELTKTLEASGIEVIETDIGDRILQLLNLKPSHPTGPISHVSAEEIVKRFSQNGVEIGNSSEEIVKFIRADVVHNLHRSRIGITGANAITAEEGSITIAHNEGNIFEVMRNEKQIVVTSVDKIYPTIEDAMNMLKVLAYNATGSIIPSFVEVISGVSKTADVAKKFFKGVHNPNEISLILIDNKRSEIANSEFKELLYCIGCGNCLIHCPMYNAIGNDFAKDNYLGGRGLVYNALSNGEDEKLDYCLSCGKCRASCPLEIDVPGIVRKMRDKGIPHEVYCILKSHAIWAYYTMMIKGANWNIVKRN